MKNTYCGLIIERRTFDQIKILCGYLLRTIKLAISNG